MTVVNYRALLHPDDARPAPGALAVVQALVNTLDRETGDDVLASPTAAAAWLARAGLRERLSREDWQQLLSAREALRTLLSANAGVLESAGSEAAAATLREAARVTADVTPDGRVTLRGEGEGARRLISDAVLAIHDAQVAGTWPRLKVCANPTCRWGFYDASRNRTGSWCSMAECGNRAKAQRFRSRRHADDERAAANSPRSAPESGANPG
jgi:predicted RNA-binding Zn ribbon-like protein